MQCSSEFRREENREVVRDVGNAVAVVVDGAEPDGRHLAVEDVVDVPRKARSAFAEVVVAVNVVGFAVGRRFARRPHEFEEAVEAGAAAVARGVGGVHVAGDEDRSVASRDLLHLFDDEFHRLGARHLIDIAALDGRRAVREVGVEEEKLLAGAALAQFDPQRRAELVVPPALDRLGDVLFVEEEIPLGEHLEAVFAPPDRIAVLRVLVIGGQIVVLVLGQFADQILRLREARLLHADHVGLDVADHRDGSLLAGVPRRVALVARIGVADVVAHDVEFAFGGCGFAFVVGASGQSGE